MLPVLYPQIVNFVTSRKLPLPLPRARLITILPPSVATDATCRCHPPHSVINNVPLYYFLLGIGGGLIGEECQQVKLEQKG